MECEDALPTIKILLIGSSGVGKSALLQRYCDDKFDPEASAATIGIDFQVRKMTIGGKPYRVNLFDTAGQERFRTLSTSFYRGSHGVLLVYDISNRATFLAMERWFLEVETNTTEDIALHLVGTKLDKAAQGREVSTEEGCALAKKHGALFSEVSSLTRENVRKPFADVINQIMQTPALAASIHGGRPPGTVTLGGDGGGGSWGCAC
ncbi:P-loop containing nucleoside triphosphate hydrolase protein [Schizothecium vesticola]|uniref:P-loop containing nucleoside triphosphate hydrolase protein n=1 Tax=Schizothecium vesticola TaxID=314040 RepID=A0AA40KD55_9PEZI|nr:P-loop containing nucleoside triphosphate hydrolase protein [Schizothecium vesticola]